MEHSSTPGTRARARAASAAVLAAAGLAGVLAWAAGVRLAAPGHDATSLATALALPAAALALAWPLPRTPGARALVRSAGGLAAGAAAVAAALVLGAEWLGGPPELLGAVRVGEGRVAGYAAPGPATAPWTAWVQAERPVLGGAVPGLVRVRRLRTWPGAADLRLAPEGRAAVRVAARAADRWALPEVVAAPELAGR